MVEDRIPGEVKRGHLGGEDGGMSQEKARGWTVTQATVRTATLLLEGGVIVVWVSTQLW